MNKLPNIKNIMPTIRGLNLWMIKQKIKDYTVQRKSTMNLTYRMDIYKLNDEDREIMFKIQDGNKQQEYIKTHGVLNRSTGDMPSHSFVIAFMQLMELAFAGSYRSGYADSITIYDITNTARTTSTYGVWYYSSGVYASALETIGTDGSTHGILCGTGTTTPTSADYNMETLIEHGAGAGQLIYQSCSVSTPFEIGTGTKMIVSRPITNVSGGNITIREIGMVIKSPNTSYYFLIAHDALNQTINDDESAIITYAFSTTV